MRKIEELVRNQCHDGRLVGGEVADGVREITRELWIVSNYVEEYELLSLLRKLNVSKTWISSTLKRNIDYLLRRYGLG
jgi:hypothetical protein